MVMDCPDCSRHFHSLRLYGLLALLLALILAPTAAAAAQDSDSGKLIISPLDTTAFPAISFTINAYDPSGALISDLQPQEISILEDGQAVGVSQLEQYQPGVHFIVAYNSGPHMATQQEDISLYMRTQMALTDWVQSRPVEGPDGFSIITNSNYQALHLDQQPMWVDALLSYQPQPASDTPSLVSLSQALDVAADPTQDAAQRRAVLYITTPPSIPNQAAMISLAQRARQLNVPVFVWMVTTPNTSDAQAEGALLQLANASGGKMFIYTGMEALPSPEEYLAPLRSVLRATFTSRAVASGDHTVTVSFTRNGLTLTTPAQTYSANVLPPNPIFLAPPTQIIREWSAPVGEEETALLPTTQPIRIMVEFPDGHPRALTASRLFVDGVLAVENTAEPFDTFEWPLEAYTQSGQHLLRVEVVDVLGLSQNSIETPVDLQVAAPRLSLVQRLISDRRLLIGLALLVSGAVLVSVLIYTGRRSGWQADRRRQMQRFKDPVTQPVNIRQDGVRTNGLITAPKRRATQSAGRSPSMSERKPLFHSKPAPRTPPQSETGLISSNPPAVSAPAAVNTLSRTTVDHESERPVFRLTGVESNLHDEPRLVRLDPGGEALEAQPIVLNHKEITLGSDPNKANILLSEPSVSPLHARFFQQDAKIYMADCSSVAGSWVNYAPVSTHGVCLANGDLIHIGRETFRFETGQSLPQRTATVTVLKED